MRPQSGCDEDTRPVLSATFRWRGWSDWFSAFQTVRDAWDPRRKGGGLADLLVELELEVDGGGIGVGHAPELWGDRREWATKPGPQTIMKYTGLVNCVKLVFIFYYIYSLLYFTVLILVVFFEDTEPYAAMMHI